MKKPAALFFLHMSVLMLLYPSPVPSPLVVNASKIVRKWIKLASVIWRHTSAVQDTCTITYHCITKYNYRLYINSQ